MMKNLSIIIPAFNEKNYIQQTVARITQLLADSIVYEVIVVDNASTDATPEYALKQGAKVISMPESITVAAARNAGVEKSCGEFLAFLDADILVTQQWAQRVVSLVADGEVNKISGLRCAVAECPSWIERSWFSLLGKVKSSYINSANMLMSRQTYDSVEGFDGSLATSEDVDFCRRARERNISLAHDPLLVVHHEGYPKTILAFMAREAWHGSSAYVSIREFCSCKTAIFSLFYVLTLVTTTTALVFKSNIFGGGLAMLLLLLPVLFLYYKFKRVPLSLAPQLYLVSLAYIIGRFFAFTKVASRKQRDR